MIEEHNPAISRQVIEMITVANEYCLFFETIEQYSDTDILNYFQKIAPLLYLKGSLLPRDLEPEPEYFERFVTEEQWEGVFKTLRTKLGSKERYFLLDHNNDSIEASLADNMADIFQDMKDFVLLYQKAPIQSKVCAVAELQKLFENHWGIRITQAIGVVHNLLFSSSINPDLFSEEIDDISNG